MGWPRGALYILTAAAAVDGQDGAAELEAAAYEYLGNRIDNTAANGSPSSGNQGSGNATVQANAACDLLKSADAKTALNGAVGAQQQGGDGCSFAGTAPGSSVELEVYDTGRPGFDNARSRISPVTNLPGVGDAAFVFSSAAGFVQVSVVKNGTFFVVTVANDEDSQRQSRAVALAKTIAGRVK